LTWSAILPRTLQVLLTLFTWSAILPRTLVVSQFDLPPVDIMNRKFQTETLPELCRFCFLSRNLWILFIQHASVNNRTADNTWTDVLSAGWSERNHQRQYHGEHRAGATQHPSAVPIITLIGNGPGGCFVSKTLSGDSAFSRVHHFVQCWDK